MNAYLTGKYMYNEENGQTCLPSTIPKRHPSEFCQAS